MKLVSRKNNARSATVRWHNAYSKNTYHWEGVGHKGGVETKQDTYKNLLSLGDNPSPEEVDRVIGNNSWTVCQCSECRKYVEEMVQVGEDPDYESSTAEICFDCLKKALELRSEKS